MRTTSFAGKFSSDMKGRAIDTEEGR